MSNRRRTRNKSKVSKPPVDSASDRITRSEPERPPLNRRRTWLFRLAAMFLAPILFFVLLEVGLRLGGYGYPTAFLVGPDSNGAYTTNPKFGWRFFSRSLARATVPCLISAKPADTVRIFVLGSSAAQGVPNPSFSLGRILEALLQEHYPNLRFEVVNAAMTAINSHVALEIARDCAPHQPDLFVLYMGNNEVVGPFGPGTVFQTWTPSRKVIQANIWLKSTRIGQLLGDAAGWFRSRKGSPDVWRGMAMFLDNPISADDPRLTAVYENFRQNLLDICSIARHSGASVILSTVGTNLKDCPPFGSRRRTDLSSDELTRWNASFLAGVEKESEGRWLEAMEQYEAAAKIDDRYAELPFRMGRCLAALGRLDEARTQFILARDLDVLRFRADTQINAAIRRAADQLKDANVYLADAEEALATNDAADNGILGDNLLYEHVHFTFEGNYELAKIVMGQIEKALPQLAASRREGPLLSKEQAAQALTFTPWDEYQMMDQMKTMMSRPPFTNQLEHAQRQAAAREKVRKLSQTSGSPRSMHEAYAAYEAAVKETPDDWDLHRRFGLLATQIGRADVAIDHLRLVLEKLPLNTKASIDLANALQKNNQIAEAVAEYQKALEPDADGAMVHCRLGTILSDRGKIDEAIAHFRKAAEIDPQLALPHNNLGNALSDRGQIDEAIAEYQKALELDPEGAMVHYNLGTIFDNRGQIDEAIAHYKKAIEIQPGYAMAHYNLGAILNDRGQTDEAVAHYEKALEIKPDFANAHNNLGIALISRGQIDEAIAHFQKAVETSPGFAMAHNNLGNALSGKGRIDEAIAEFRKAIEIEPRFAMAHDNLGNALSSQGKIDEAIVHFRKTLEIDPGFSDARQNLERLLKPNSK